jgi:hypothetical protein
MVHIHNTGNQFAIERDVTRPETRERRSAADRRSEVRHLSSVERRVEVRSSESQTYSRGFGDGSHHGFRDGIIFGIVLGLVGTASIVYVTRFIS